MGSETGYTRALTALQRTADQDSLLTARFSATLSSTRALHNLSCIPSMFATSFLLRIKDLSSAVHFF